MCRALLRLHMQSIAEKATPATESCQAQNVKFDRPDNAELIKGTFDQVTGMMIAYQVGPDQSHPTVDVKPYSSWGHYRLWVCHVKSCNIAYCESVS